MRLLSAAAEPGSCIWVKSYGHFKGVFMCAVMASHFLLLNGHVWKIGSGCQRPINLRLKPIFTHHAVLCYQLWNFWVKNEQFNIFFIPINILSNHGISYWSKWNYPDFSASQFPMKIIFLISRKMYLTHISFIQLLYIHKKLVFQWQIYNFNHWSSFNLNLWLRLIFQAS